MKNIIIALVAIVTFTSCNQQKIGYVDLTKLMKDYDAVKDLEKEMEQKSKDFQAKYQQIAADLDAQAKAGKLSQADYQKNGQELQMAYQQEGSALQADSEQRSNKIIDDVKDFVKEYAKKNGYNFIFGASESGNLLYGEEKADLTDILIDAINKDYKDGDKTEKAPKEEKEISKDTTKSAK